MQPTLLRTVRQFLIKSSSLCHFVQNWCRAELSVIISLIMSCTNAAVLLSGVLSLPRFGKTEHKAEDLFNLTPKFPGLPDFQRLSLWSTERWSQVIRLPWAEAFLCLCMWQLCWSCRRELQAQGFSSDGISVCPTPSLGSWEQVMLSLTSSNFICCHWSELWKRFWKDRLSDPNSACKFTK